MKSRWILNLVLLAIVAGIVAFLHLRPKAEIATDAQHEISQLKLAEFNRIVVEYPTKAPMQFDKVDGLWRMVAPYKTRADQAAVTRILAIIAAKSSEKLPSTDLAKYGLDNPQLRLKLTRAAGEEVFVFGTHNPINDMQYVAYQDAVYLLTGDYETAAATQAIEIVDKAPLASTETKQIAGFDFSKLEQWQELGGLTVSYKDGNWQASLPKAKPTQNEMNEWVDMLWKQGMANSVTMYKPDLKAHPPSFEVILADGKKVHIDKLQESPEYLLGRADEGLVYHFPNDVGFSMTNPPLNLK